jgi:hypothetical protein
MKKMSTSNILIIGLKGLGIEIGKQSKQANSEAHTKASESGTTAFGEPGKILWTL